MEAVIPEPSPTNIKRYKQGIWRKTMPKGLRMRKFVEGPDGTLIHDNSYVGEDAWDEEPEAPESDVNQLIHNNTRLTPQEKKKLKKELGISGIVQESKGTWREQGFVHGMKLSKRRSLLNN